MAAPAYVQSLVANDTGFNNTLTSAAFGSSTTSGNGILVIGFAEAAASDLTTCTDSKSNTYNSIATASDATSLGIKAWLALNITGGASHTVTVNDSGFVIAGFIAIEISGLPTSGNALDASGGNFGSGGTVSANATGATTNATDLLIFAGTISSGSGTWTAGNLGGTTGTIRQNGSASAEAMSYAVETNTVSSTGSYGGSMTQSVTNQNFCGLFLALSNVAIVAAAVKQQQYKYMQAVKRGAYW